MIQWIRSFIFFILLILIGALFIPLMIIASYCVREKYYYPLVKWWCTLALWLLKVLTGVKYRITGLENIKLLDQQPALIVSNHQSTFETFLYPIIFKQYCFVLKKELLNIPVFGQGLCRLNPVAIDRSQGKKAFKMMIDMTKQRLSKNIPVIVFPEGTRVLPNESIPYKNGAFLVASKLEAPILPISINSGCAWPKGRLLKQKGTIEVTIGQFIESQNKTASELNAETYQWIEKHKKKELSP